MSGFWLKLRGRSKARQSWVTQFLALKFALLTLLPSCGRNVWCMFPQAEWECSIARRQAAIYWAAVGLFQKDVSQIPRGRSGFPWRSRCFQMPPACFALESCWVQAVFFFFFFSRAQCSKMQSVWDSFCVSGLFNETSITSQATRVWGRASNSASKDDPVSLRLYQSDCAVFEHPREWLWGTVNGVTYTRNCFYTLLWECCACVRI